MAKEEEMGAFRQKSRGPTYKEVWFTENVKRSSRAMKLTHLSSEDLNSQKTIKELDCLQILY
jgi:hypothetical protein